VLAVDGIVWYGRAGDRIQLGCEMDPPGGWERVSLDRATGRELARGVRRS
jgi:hypothetical protein